ncbi:ABC transporter permease subunit [Eubacteriales bacterium OttesenSCG-928-A19]|nr:ABC transporter permease subunit [Eubacteriales bacterium OttesenSCG-928-A19]
MAESSVPKRSLRRDGGLVRRALSCWQLYILMIPALVWLVVFAYFPMYGLVIAFKDFKIRAGILASPWAEPLFKYFTQFFSTSIAITSIKNTVLLSLYQLLFAFWVPIVFALLLNQIRRTRLRKAIQTISYAPYFLSNVVLVCVISMLFSANGVVNNVITSLGGELKLFTSQAQYFRPLYVGSSIWQTMGFNAIIYIAALVGISPDYYEAAVIDGATKFQRILHIDIPLIMPTVLLMFILAVGNIMTIGYEKAYLMQSSANTTVSEIISTYVYKVGLQSAQYSFATAVGLFNAIVNFVILVGANMLSRKLADISIF